MPSRETQFANGHEPTNGHARKSPYQQVVEIQQLLLNDIRNPSTNPAARSSCARAFDILEERKRILRMRFRPGDLRAADLDPVKLAWWVKRARVANKTKLIDLPSFTRATADDPQGLAADEEKPAARVLTGGTEPEATGPAAPPARKESF